MNWYWLSFVDPELPLGKQFLGVAVVAVNERSIEFIDRMDPTDRIQLLRERGQEEDVPFYVAIFTARLWGINPGGAVQGWDITDSIDDIPETMRHRLLSKQELVDAGLAPEEIVIEMQFGWGGGQEPVH